MRDKIELLKQYLQSKNCYINDIVMELTKSKILYMIVEFSYGLKAFKINDCGSVDKIGWLNYKIENSKMYISYLQSNLQKGEGVGTALLKRARNIANRNGFKEIYLDSLQKAGKFYEKLGFKAGSIVNKALELRRYSFNPKNSFL